MNTMCLRLVFTSLAFLFSALLFSAEAQLNVKKKTVSERRFGRLMQRDNTVILDVRTPKEYAAGHIDGAVNMDVQDDGFKEQIRLLDKSKTYLLYCKSGRRSEKALRILSENDFAQVYHLKGGYTAWTTPGKGRD